MEAGMAQQPALNRGGFVGAVVVEDQVQFQLAGHCRVNGFKKAFEFGGAMAPVKLADYGAGLGVERGEQIDGAVTHVISAAALGLAGTHRQQQWLRSSAWIWVFSSTHNTNARSGGLRYKPAMSRTFSKNSGSLESLKLSTRCGCRANARQ